MASFNSNLAGMFGGLFSGGGGGLLNFLGKKGVGQPKTGEADSGITAFDSPTPFGGDGQPLSGASSTLNGRPLNEEGRLTDEERGVDTSPDNAFGSQRRFGSKRLIEDEGRAPAHGLQRRNIGRLGQRLARTLAGSNLDLRLQDAAGLLSERGQIDPRIANEERIDIERQRQLGQQGLDQATATDPNAARLARSGLLNEAARGAQVQGSLRRAVEQTERERSDLGSILGNLFINPALQQVSGIIESPERGNFGASNMDAFLGLAGNALGAFGGAGGFDRKSQSNSGFVRSGPRHDI